MGTDMIAICVVTVLALAAVAATILWCRWQQQGVMDGLSDMVEAAVNGTFSEKNFDESRRSALENRLAQYLAASALSVRNIDAEREKIKTLIADISHQTRTPISNIILYTELLEEEIPNPETQETLSMLRQQSEKLQFLIDALVKLSRLETGVFVLHPKVQALNEMVKAALEGYRNRAESKGLVMKTVGEAEADRDLAGTVCACFDARWSMEALGNILDNAIKYTDDGTITVCIRSYELFACVEVSDTGMGISEQEHAKVFKRFYRGEAVTNESGVGIGLYLAREIMQQQGGYIRLSSRPGSGSTFGLYFPKENVSKL